MPQTSSVVFLTEVGKELGLFDENRKYGEDIQFYQKFLLKDSYYILAEKLTEIEIGKKYFGEKGLTNDLYKMHCGRNKNVNELYRYGLITKFFMNLMIVCNYIKYVRRVLIMRYNKIIYKN